MAVHGWQQAGVPGIYVLEFSRDGIVTDVLHKSYRYKLGHSALQYQYMQHDMQHVEAELQTLGRG